jgi:hypothetical protein
LPSSPDNFIFNNFHVTQYPKPPDWPSDNECVTAATIQDMNMMQVILASKFGIPQLQQMDLPTFAKAFDEQPLWLIRPPADAPIVGGMLHPQSAVLVLKGHSEWLRENYGCGYDVKLTSGNTVDDLIENLQNGYPTSIHISQNVDFFKDGKYNDWRALIGGAPHTVTLVGYDQSTDTWLILDPGNPSGYTRKPTSLLMDEWGRQFLLYPRRFAMTTLIPDTTCTFPPAAITGIAIPPVATPPTPTGTPPPSQIP